MRVLVTGGAGYIGSVVAQELIRSSHKVVVYDDLSHGYRAAVPVEAEFVQGNIADSEKLGLLFDRFSIEGVIHLAAFIEAGESMRDPSKHFVGPHRVRCDSPSPLASFFSRLSAACDGSPRPELRCQSFCRSWRPRRWW